MTLMRVRRGEVGTAADEPFRVKVQGRDSRVALFSLVLEYVFVRGWFANFGLEVWRQLRTLEGRLRLRIADPSLILVRTIWPIFL